MTRNLFSLCLVFGSILSVGLCQGSSSSLPSGESRSENYYGRDLDGYESNQYSSDYPEPQWTSSRYPSYSEISSSPLAKAINFIKDSLATTSQDRHGGYGGVEGKIPAPFPLIVAGVLVVAMAALAAQLLASTTFSLGPSIFDQIASSLNGDSSSSSGDASSDTSGSSNVVTIIQATTAAPVVLTPAQEAGNLVNTAAVNAATSISSASFAFQSANSAAASLETRLAAANAAIADGSGSFRESQIAAATSALTFATNAAADAQVAATIAEGFRVSAQSAYQAVLTASTPAEISAAILQAQAAAAAADSASAVAREAAAIATSAANAANSASTSLFTTTFSFPK